MPSGVDALAGYGTAANERLAERRASTFRSAANSSLHADGNWTKTDDLRTGGHILSKDLREAARASADPEIQALADLKGELPNSAAESKEGALGFAYVDGGLNIGVSVTRHEADIPGADPLFARPGRRGGSADHRPGADALRLPRRSSGQRILQPRPRSRRLCRLSPRRARRHGRDRDPASSARAAKAGSSWSRRSARGWGGTSGVQYLDRNARIRGEEKFLPDSEQRAGRPVHAADPRQRAVPLRRRRPRRVQQARRRGRRSARRRPPGRATSRPSPARSAASTNSRPAGAPA